jgi:hypothetical protein
MRRHRKTQPSAVEKQRPAGSCHRPPRTDATLSDLVHEYLRDIAPKHRHLLDWYRRSKSLAEAIEKAAGLVGNVPDHQRRVGRRVLNKARQRLMDQQRQIKKCDSFDSLFRLVEEITSDIHDLDCMASPQTSDQQV